MNKREQPTETLCMTSEKGERIFSADEMKQIKNNIGRRIIEVFNYQPNLEIAFLLRSSCKTVKSITEGEDFPPVEMLLCIHKITGVSIHWLLTGEGAKHPFKDLPLAAMQESALLGLA
jgi:hypothetical protein